MIRILVLVFLIISIACFAFRDLKSVRQVNHAGLNFDTCILHIYSPYNCYYEIVINKTGGGNMKAFVKNETAGKLKSDSMISRFAFSIGLTSDKPKLNKIIAQVKAEDTLNSPGMFDTYRFELVIDKKKYIDVYGQNAQINRLLKMVFKYVRSADDRCGFFRLFQEVEKNIKD